MSPSSADRAAPAAEVPAVRGCTGLRLRALTRIVTRHYDAQLSRTGLRLTQYTLLSYLRSTGETGHSALAQALGMDRTTLTRNLKPLVEAGWITQARAGGDARSTRLRLTEAGLAQWQQARPQWLAAQRSLNDTLGVERVAALHRLMDESIAVLSPVPPGGG